ncbi:MAG: tRNA(Ile)-lysidine synthase [Planctomycetaceae bacterium]
MNSGDRQATFLKKLDAGLQRCGFVEGRILVGVSGGADSVALLRGLAFLVEGTSDGSRSTDRLEIVAAHIDHQIRDDSKDDAKWVRSLAAELNLDCRVETANVLGRVAETQESIEEAARKSRYETLLRIAQEEQCGAVAVAHTADDQAETVLHHLVRGTSVTGLRGMLWSRPLEDGPTETGVQLIRPMLEIRRTELEHWLAEIGQTFRTDPTNNDDTLTRNRIRHGLLPTLEQDFNPQIRNALGTLAGHAAEVSDLLRSLTTHLVDASLVQLSDDSIRIDCPALAGQPPILIRETLLTVWQRAGWPLKRMGHREWDRLSHLVTQDGGGAVSLPERIEARRRGQLLVLSRESVSLK